MSVTPINIISATQTGEYLIRLCFDDQSEQEVNFKPFLTRSNHPDIRAYLDPVRFGAFRIEYGELVWGDYDLCSVLVSDVSGKPLAPVVHNLVNDTQVHTPMNARPRAHQKHLDELSERMGWIEARGWDKPLVHIVDREGDSVAHWRTWSAQGSRFLVRAKDAPKVCFEGVPIKPKELAERLSYRSAGEVLYHGRSAHQNHRTGKGADHAQGQARTLGRG